MKSNTSVLLGIVGTLMIVVGIGFLWAMWQFNSPPFDLAKLQQLQKGMSEEQVQQILGDPSSKEGATWHYGSAMAWPIVHIYFDESGRLKSHEYDF